MPRLIDYTARFELIREAVVRIAARDGGAAVSLTSVAQEMRVSASTVRRELRSPDVLCETGLVLLARQWQIKRFTHGRPPRHVSDLVERARWALWTELPLREAEVEAKRAWAELVHHGTGQRVTELRDDQAHRGRVCRADQHRAGRGLPRRARPGDLAAPHRRRRFPAGAGAGELQPRRRRSSSLIAGTTSCMSPTTA